MINNLRQLDLNLLVTLDVLLTEHNVTRAAQRLNLSQPSISVHLSKLRDIFEDPLLLPGPRGMQPTARADELRQPLRLALETLEHAILPASPFNPALASHTWRIAAFDYSEATILLPLLADLRIKAPKTKLAVFATTPSRMLKQAEQGDFDFIFHTSAQAPSSLRRRILFSEQYVLVGRVGHPRLNNPPTLEEFCELDHVIMSSDGGGFVGSTDEKLAKIGLKRNVVLSVPHFLFMVSVLANTDMVAMLPSRLAINDSALQIVEAPFELQGYEIAMLWHERSHRDPAHQWLREYIAGSV